MNEDRKELFQQIPSVDRLLARPPVTDALDHYARSVVLSAIHVVLEEIRDSIISHRTDEALLHMEEDAIVELVIIKLKQIARSSLRRVVNATGVVIHTNLGRSILAERVIRKLGPLSGGYSNLEYDLDTGKRGSRNSHVEGILTELTSAESAIVVNNNAAAVFICLETLAQGREVIVSRGQLVEIGGSFRIPDVMKKSGAHMVEVGTTNKTRIRDYEQVIGPDTALLLKVHRSNFQIVGFTEEVCTAELAELGKRYSIPLIEDLGSGSLIDFSRYGLIKEPTVQEVLAAGADIVMFSGDKLLGGPQAGIIVGKKDLIKAIRSNQLARVLRIDKLTLLALEETLKIYRDERTAIQEIPTLRMICEPYQSLRDKARRLVRMIGKQAHDAFHLDIAQGNSKVGGGALPLLELPTSLVRLIPHHVSAHNLYERLKSNDPPIIGRVESDMVLLDVRTILNSDLKEVARAVKALNARCVKNAQ